MEGANAISLDSNAIDASRAILGSRNMTEQVLFAAGSGGVKAAIAVVWLAAQALLYTFGVKVSHEMGIPFPLILEIDAAIALLLATYLGRN